LCPFGLGFAGRGSVGPTLDTAGGPGSMAAGNMKNQSTNKWIENSNDPSCKYHIFSIDLKNGVL